jgi:hypothetical protein
MQGLNKIVFVFPPDAYPQQSQLLKNIDCTKRIYFSDIFAI